MKNVGKTVFTDKLLGCCRRKAVKNVGKTVFTDKLLGVGVGEGL